LLAAATHFRRRAANFTAAAAPDIFDGAPNFSVATSNAIHPGLERLLFKNLGFLKSLKILKNPKIRFLGFSNLNFLKI
jgi:hypothetical protein